MKKWLVGTAVVTASALAAVSLAFAGSTTLFKISASKTSLAYNKKVLTAKTGKVTIVMTNPSFLSHDVAIKGNGVRVKGKVVGKGGTSRVTANLKPGTYTFYCTVPGHEAAGMKGKLIVK
ncbi:MAG TPA: plastocyanin/azurin family copper-binding protein [Gaiellaceae bacterium]|jgi:plastocyanin|nr:plastocyanin/azurin family copper-binding protein [Gaiellaceae bacterium]